MGIIYLFFGLLIIYDIYFISNIVYIKRYGTKIIGKVSDNKPYNDGDGFRRYIALIKYTNTLGEEGICKVRTTHKSPLNTTFELVEYKKNDKINVKYMPRLLEILAFLLFLTIMLWVEIIIELS